MFSWISRFGRALASSQPHPNTAAYLSLYEVGWQAGLGAGMVCTAGPFQLVAAPWRSLNAFKRSQPGSETIYCPHDGLDRQFEKSVIFQFSKVML